MAHYLETYRIVIFILYFMYTHSLECIDRCDNGGICSSFNNVNGSVCTCADEYSGASCESRSRYAALMFLCDSGANMIFEASADELEFHSLPLPNLRQPVAVGYDYEDDVVYWVNADDGSLNRAGRNGSGYDQINVGHGIIDLAIHVPTRRIAWINTERTLSGLFHYSSGLRERTFTGNNFTTIASHPNGSFIIVDITSTIDIHTLDNSFNIITTRRASTLDSVGSVALDRQGTRLYLIDDQKQTIESFGPEGEDHVTLFRTEGTSPIDITWYRGTPLWTEATQTRGVILLNGNRDVSPASTNLIHFQVPAGIHTYHGQSYSKALYGRCLEDEYSCEDLCLPLSWQCDGLPDCPDQSDEFNCDPTEDAGPLMFLTSLSGGAIYVSHANSLDFRKLPFLFVESPVAVGYDVIGKDVYWTDVERKVLNAAQMDGSNQRIVAQGLGVPDGLFVDSENGVIFWTDAQLKTIETIEFDGSNQRVLINDLDMPRAIIVVPTNDKLYWTDWGTTPNIEMSNRDGSDRQVIIDTELGWPNGITYDIKGNRLIWCDARLDKIESSDLDGSLRRTLLGVTHGVLHPFGVVVYEGTLMWSDWMLQGVGIMEGQNHTWPSLYSSIGIIQQPSGFCIVVDACSAGPCKFGTCQPFNVSNYECHCMTGYTGKNCDTESPKNSITLTLGIMSSLATLVLMAIVVFGICTCMKQRDQSPVNNRTTPKQVDDRGPLPCVPSDINEDYHYYSGLTDPTSDHGHIYMTSLADKTQRDTLDSRYSYLRPNSTA